MPVGKPAPPRPRRPRGLHRVDDPLGTLGDGLLDGLVAVELDVLVDVGCALAEAAREHSYFIGMGDEGGHYFTSFPWPSRYISKIASTLLGGEVVVEVVVDLHGGSPAAGADALDLFERKDAVRRDVSLCPMPSLCLQWSRIS